MIRLVLVFIDVVLSEHEVLTLHLQQLGLEVFNLDYFLDFRVVERDGERLALLFLTEVER